VIARTRKVKTMTARELCYGYLSVKLQLLSVISATA